MAKNAVKPHSAEPSAAVHAAVGDALLSLATDLRLSHKQLHPQHLMLRMHVVIHHVKTTHRWPSTMSASWTKWPTRGDFNSRLIVFRRLIMSL